MFEIYIVNSDESVIVYDDCRKAQSHAEYLTSSEGYEFAVRKVTMTNAEIIDFYDRHPDLTLASLSKITGKSVADLKRLLMGQ